jgi:hypothetical protein
MTVSDLTEEYTDCCGMTESRDFEIRGKGENFKWKMSPIQYV